MLPSINWLHVTVAAAAGSAISMIFYSLPIMRTQREKQAATNVSRNESATGSQSLLSAMLARLVNTFLFSFMLAWFLQLTGISTLGMGLLLLLVAMGRAALAPGDLPQVAEFNTLRSMDAAGECSAYDGFKACRIV